jgi:hypothetical protein
VQLGLATGPASGLTDPFAASDPNLAQLCEYLTSLGSDLTINHNWPQFRKEYTFVTSSAQNVYQLPADFHEMIDQTGWNRSTRMPLAGPATPQEWQYLKSRAPSLLINVVFRLDGDTANAGPTLEINPGVSPPDSQTIAFEYMSDLWAMTTGGSTPDKRAPTVGSDVVFYDDELIIAGLKLAWRSDRGFDTMELRETFERRLEHCIGKSLGAVTISLDGALRGVDRLIDDRNLPITGFGV